MRELNPHENPSDFERMKFRISFKTPDAVFYATEDMSEDDKAEAQRVAKLFVKYGEVIVVEFDTEAETATVKP